MFMFIFDVALRLVFPPPSAAVPRSDQDSAKLLCCDGMDHFGCTAVYHTYCCDPPLARPPPGDWFCPACRKLFELQDIDKLMDVRWAADCKMI